MLTRTHICSRFAFAIMFISVTSAIGAQQGPPPSHGTAIIRGDVVDRVTGAAVAHAEVAIMDMRGGKPRGTATDANGRFVVSNLPAGEYMLAVRKFGYLTWAPGSETTTLRGKEQRRMVVAADRESRVQIALAPASVLIGRVLAPNGEPIEGARMSLLRVPFPGARPRPVEVIIATNDAGEFRIPRVEPGSYLVRAEVVHMSSDRDDGRMLAPAYYPGVTSMSGATAIEVSPGATVTGLDIVIQEITTTIVTGTVIDVRGQPLSDGSVHVWADRDGARVGVSLLADDSRLHDDGTFRLRLPPGDYWLTSHQDDDAIGSVSFEGGPDGAAPPSQAEVAAMMAAMQRELRERSGSAAVRVTVAGERLDGVTLKLEPPVTLAGRFVFEGGAPGLEAAFYASLNLKSTADDYGCHEMGMGRGSIDMQPDGRFEQLVAPGTCIPTVTTMAPGWSLKAIEIGGVDVTQRAITLEHGRPPGEVRVIFTNRHNELSFAVADPTGASTNEYVAVVFPVDERLWSETPNIHLHIPGAVGAAFPDRDGMATPSMGPHANYSAPLRGLPPGEYFAIALDDATWRDVTSPDLLRRFAEQAITFQIKSGETRRLDLRRVGRARF